MLFEGAETSEYTSDHVHCSDFYQPFRVARDLVWELMQQEIETDRHFSSGNYLFADGHVATIAAETVQGWVQQDIAEGTNFAQPNSSGIYSTE